MNINKIKEKLKNAKKEDFTFLPIVLVGKIKELLKKEKAKLK